MHFMLHLRLIIMKHFNANGENLQCVNVCQGLGGLHCIPGGDWFWGGPSVQRVFRAAVTGAWFSWVSRDESMSFLILRQTHPQRNAGVLMPIMVSKLLRYFTQHLIWIHLWSFSGKVFEDKIFCLHSGVYISNCLSEDENLPIWELMLEEGRKKEGF